MKKGQMDLSFGMIWAIIIVIVFIAFAIYVIIHFLSVSDKVKIEQFAEAFQSSIDDIRGGLQGSNTVSYSIPASIDKLCFLDEKSPAIGKNKDLYDTLSWIAVEENLVFYPEDSGEGKGGLVLENIDLDKITEKENPYCITNSKGKATFTISMEYGENLVTIR